MSAPLIVRAERSGFAESTHEVDVAVVDQTGQLIAHAGEPDRPAAFRSSAKPLQARVALEAGWEPEDDEAIAIACASHNGEPPHVERVRAVLARAGVDESALACPSDAPAYVPAIFAASERRPVFHNCSGKHASMLAACIAAGWPLDGYRDREHPLQQRILETLERALGGVVAVLIDGCGVPTPVAPLQAFARAFLSIDDGGPEAAAMRAHPFLVGGSERFDTDVMQVVPRVLTKAGAEGLACVSVDGIGIALKARDGDLRSRIRGPAVLHVLRALGLVGDDELRALERHAAPPILGGGRPVGSVVVEGLLDRT